MMNNISRKEYIKRLSIFRAYCKKYIWDLPELLRRDLSLFLIKLDKEIEEEKLRIAKWKQEQERRQVTIYDLEGINDERD